MKFLINRENLWSDSLTKDNLTVYAEGLACNNFNKNIFYNLRRLAKDTWYVLKKQQVRKVNKIVQINCFVLSTFD